MWGEVDGISSGVGFYKQDILNVFIIVRFSKNRPMPK